MKRIAQIEIRLDFVKNDVKFKRGETYFAEILSVGFTGGFDRHSDSTMEGSIDPCAIIHIYEAWPDANQNAIGLLICLIIDYHAKITYHDVV